MPELPEVEVLRAGLNQKLKGSKITGFKVLNPKVLKPDFRSFVSKNSQDLKILGFNRFSKLLTIDLDNGNTVLIHLAMTGQLIFRTTNLTDDKKEISDIEQDKFSKNEYNDLLNNEIAGGHPNESFVGQLPDNTTKFIFQLKQQFKQGDLFFNDQRMFGSIDYYPTSELKNSPYISKLGPEPLNADDNKLQQYLINISKKKRSDIKTTLMDQSVVAGCGNIYANETLWESKINPTHLVQDLSEAQLTSLFQNMAKVFEISIKSGGSSLKNYLHIDGSIGDYLDSFANVYNREGLPCKRCNTPIKKISIKNRGTYFCPKCQQ